MKQEPSSPPFFTSEDSPVPPVPPADAWTAMRARLDAQAAGKKRRGAFWLSPVGCVALLLLLAGVGVGLWWVNSSSTAVITDQLPAVSQDSLPATDPAADKIIEQANDAGSKTDLATAQPAQPGVTPATLRPASAGRPQHRVVRTNYPMADKSISAASTIACQPGIARLLSKPVQAASVSRLQFHAPIQVYTPRPIAYGWLQVPRPLNALCEVYPSRRYQWAVGLQTEVSLPVSSTYVYFTDPQLRDRFYIPFIPGIWGSVTKGRHRLTAELKPFSHALLPGNDQQDSTRLGGRSLVKSFGMQAGLAYSYRIDAHWWLGASMVGSLWRKGIAALENGPNASDRQLTTMRNEREDGFWPSAIGANIQIAYATGRWEGMLQVESPFGKAGTGKLMMWSRIGVRYQLWHSGANFQ